MGGFVWFDLMTTDPEGAWDFYTKVVGWGRQPMEGSDYNMIVGPHGPIGGIEELSQRAADMGAPTHWLGFVGVDDVDVTATRAIELGGKVLVGPNAIPDGGRITVLQDPTGAVVAAHNSANKDWKPNPEVAPGAMVWHECYAGDLEPAWAFYVALFGWEKADSMSMGDSGEYRMYRAAGDDRTLGGMMTKPAALPSPAWLYYVNVGDVPSAAARVTEHGGQVMNGPMEIPGGEWVAHCFDPQGGFFAIHGTNAGATDQAPSTS